MTEEQQNLVIENYNLIFSFLKNINRPKTEDLEQEMAIALCYAAKSFDSSKGAFSTLAYKCMKNRLYQIIKYEKSDKRIPENMILSIDKNLINDEEDSFTLKDIYGETDEETLEKISEDQRIENFISTALTKKQEKYLRLYLKGYSYTEIGKILNVSKQMVAESIAKTKRKYFYYYSHDYKYTELELKNFEKQKEKEN